MSNFYMLVGLPASGKTTLAYTMGATVRSSDELRSSLLGDIDDQSHNKEIFDLLHSLIKADIFNGVDVVYDATNIYSYYRREFLKSLSLLPCKKVCIYLDTPYNECLSRNAKRERKVPIEVMDKMRNRFTIPDMSEGWGEIRVIKGGMSCGGD